MAKFTQNTTFALAISLLVIFASLQHTLARPKAGPPQNSLDRITACEIDSKLQDTCQRCAKATKSNVVYPMCCSNEDEAYVWCQKYMGYGIH